MSPVDHQRRLREQIGFATRFDPDPDLEGPVFDRCCEILDAARQLEELLAGTTSHAAGPAVLGCLGATLESLATSALELHETASKGTAPVSEERDDVVVELDRLLFAISQNLRFAARAAELGREVLAGDDRNF